MINRPESKLLQFIKRELHFRWKRRWTRVVEDKDIGMKKVFCLTVTITVLLSIAGCSLPQNEASKEDLYKRFPILKYPKGHDHTILRDHVLTSDEKTLKEEINRTSKKCHEKNLSTDDCREEMYNVASKLGLSRYDTHVFLSRAIFLAFEQ